MKRKRTIWKKGMLACQMLACRLAKVEEMLALSIPLLYVNYLSNSNSVRTTDSLHVLFHVNPLTPLVTEYVL